MNQHRTKHIKCEILKIGFRYNEHANAKTEFDFFYL